MKLPTQRQLLRLFIPLALSGIFFPLASTIVNAALARAVDPVLALAAFSVVRGLSQPFLSPLYGLRQVVTALARDRQMLRMLGRWNLILGGACTLILLFVCLPFIYQPLVEKILNIPPPIAHAGVPVLLVTVLSPLLIIGRGYYQGILVRYGQSVPVSLGALAYLVIAVGAMIIGIAWMPTSGALVGVGALCLGQVAYLVVVWKPCIPVIREQIPATDSTLAAHQRRDNYVLYFFLPVAISTLLIALTEPLVQAGMARLPQADISLAAYPVCTALTWLTGVPMWNMQQVIIAQVHDRASFKVVQRFVWKVALVLTVFMILIALPPVADWVFGSLIGTSGPIKQLAIDGFRLLVFTPLFMGGRSLFHGTLMSLDATSPIRTAAIIRLITLVLGLVGGVIYGQINGLMVALVAIFAASSVELICLYVYTRRRLRCQGS